MAGTKKIPEPKIEPGKNYYSFRFYNSNNNRLRFSTGTDSKSEAKRLAEQMFELYSLSYNDERAQDIDDRVYKEYFGHSKEVQPQNLDKILFTIDDAKLIDKYIAPHEPSFVERFLKSIEHYASLANEVEGLRESLVDYGNLKDSIAAQQARAVKLCPEYDQAFKVFIEEYESEEKTPKQIKDVIRINERFRLFVENQKPATITSDQIRDFITTQVKASKHDKNGNLKANYNPDSTRQKTTALLSVFFYRAAERYKFICPFSNMASTRNTNKKRRIPVWYDLPEVEKIIETLNPYWAAIVSTMCYAGIGIKELRGLRHEDFIKVIQLDNNGDSETLYFLNIEPHLDRTIKNKNRDDLVPVDPEYLLPHLQRFFSLNLQGEKYIFEKPQDMRRNKNSSNVWNDSHLSHKLNGDKPKFDDDGNKIRSGSKGILPKGYKARNLRHTFGSLLIRSGYSIDDACRLTRNTREVFTEHYARILGLEMRVNIKEGSKKAKILEMQSVFTA